MQSLGVQVVFVIVLMTAATVKADIGKYDTFSFFLYLEVNRKVLVSCVGFKNIYILSDAF